MILMTGCTFGLGIDALLYPPQLTDEQTAIKQALTENVGKNIKLKYPKSGDFRSAFVIANIDDEETNEAIVFYERTGIEYSDTNIRMNILDQRDNKWASVFDHSGYGTEVDKIMISKFDNNSSSDIVVGYNMLNQIDKTVKIYSYKDGKLITDYTDNYSAMQVTDIDNDGSSELILITGNIQGRESKAKLIKKINGQFTLISQVEMDSVGVDYASITKGRVNTEMPAVFVDSDKGDGTLQTQVIYTVDGQLRNPIAKIPELLAKTTRPIGYYSVDIDGDSIVEIPVLNPFPGYETAEAGQKIYITDWYVFEQYGLIKKNSGYYNINNGYCFMLPSRWQGTVTVKNDTKNDEIVFYKYSGQLNDNMTELMRITTVKTEAVGEKISEGYQLVYTKGNLNYMVKVPLKSTEPLVLTMSEIMYNLIVI